MNVIDTKDDVFNFVKTDGLHGASATCSVTYISGIDHGYLVLH